MTVHKKIIETLKPFGIPVRPDFSSDVKEEYFTFDIIDDRAEAFGDNEPIAVTAYLQIHYAAPVEKDYLELKKQVRKALMRAGFSYPEVTDATTRGDSVRHLVFECSIENEYELEE
jgi:hypothetical protein